MSFRRAAYAVCVEDITMSASSSGSASPGGQLRPEPNGETAGSVWTPIPEVACLRRSSLVDIGLALAQAGPVTGHVAPVPVGGLIQH